MTAYNRFGKLGEIMQASSPSRKYMSDRNLKVDLTTHKEIIRFLHATYQAEGSTHRECSSCAPQHLLHAVLRSADHILPRC